MQFRNYQCIVIVVWEELNENTSSFAWEIVNQVLFHYNLWSHIMMNLGLNENFGILNSCEWWFSGASVVLKNGRNSRNNLDIFVTVAVQAAIIFFRNRKYYLSTHFKGSSELSICQNLVVLNCYGKTKDPPLFPFLPLCWNFTFSSYWRPLFPGSAQKCVLTKNNFFVLSPFLWARQVLQEIRSLNFNEESKINRRFFMWLKRIVVMKQNIFYSVLLLIQKLKKNNIYVPGMEILFPDRDFACYCINGVTKWM